MSWIKTIPFEHATGKLKSLYDRLADPDGRVDNIMMAHSLRPHTMDGHLAIYRSVLHHTGNKVPKWFLELLGVWVSHLNGCEYCVQHHFAGMKKLLGDEHRGQEIRSAIFAQEIALVPVDDAQRQAMRYAQKLTERPATMVEPDMQMLRDAGFEDGGILEINQVVAYFCYANRTVLGLGCSTEGEAPR